MSLFITGLAFDANDLQANAKLGILAASLIAPLSGAAIFIFVGRRQPGLSSGPELDTVLPAGTDTSPQR